MSITLEQLERAARLANPSAVASAPPPGNGDVWDRGRAPVKENPAPARSSATAPAKATEAPAPAPTKPTAPPPARAKAEATPADFTKLATMTTYAASTVLLNERNAGRMTWDEYADAHKSLFGTDIRGPK